jgi:hypothetical protein
LARSCERRTRTEARIDWLVLAEAASAEERAPRKRHATTWRRVWKSPLSELHAQSGDSVAARRIWIESVHAKRRIEQAHKLPQELYQSLTWDRGWETADHKRFTLATDIKVYFRDPQSPWQRGSNENTNGLLRQYFPKGIALSVYSQAKLNAVARRLNERPRKH